MSERLIEKLDRFGAEAGIKEMTPEIRRFAMLVRNDMLQVWPKRDWIGLTDEEIEKLITDAGFTRSDLLMMGACIDQIARLVEAALKERNT